MIKPLMKNKLSYIQIYIDHVPLLQSHSSFLQNMLRCSSDHFLLQRRW